jgi:hypothetical protein
MSLALAAGRRAHRHTPEAQFEAHRLASFDEAAHASGRNTLQAAVESRL